MISRIDDNAGRAVVVRRAELSQQSFAQFARFDDVTLSSVTFARGIQVFGPIHTNGVLYVGSAAPRPIFHGPATTASTINAVANGDWRKRLEGERAPDRHAHPGQPGHPERLCGNGKPDRPRRGSGNHRV